MRLILLSIFLLSFTAQADWRTYFELHQCGNVIEQSERYFAQGFGKRKGETMGVELYDKVMNVWTFLETDAPVMDIAFDFNEQLYILTKKQLERWDTTTFKRVAEIRTHRELTPDKFPKRGHPHGIVIRGLLAYVAHGVLGVSQIDLAGLWTRKALLIDAAVTDISSDGEGVYLTMDNTREGSFRGIAKLDTIDLKIEKQIFTRNAYPENLYMDGNSFYQGFFNALWRFDRHGFFNSTDPKGPKPNRVFYQFNLEHPAEIWGRPLLTDSELVACMKVIDLDTEEISYRPVIYQRFEIEL